MAGNRQDLAVAYQVRIIHLLPLVRYDEHTRDAPSGPHNTKDTTMTVSKEDQAITQAFIDLVVRNYGEFKTVMLDRSGGFSVHLADPHEAWNGERDEKQRKIAALTSKVRSMEYRLARIKEAIGSFNLE